MRYSGITVLACGIGNLYSYMMPKTNMMISIDIELRSALKVAAERAGVTMISLIEEGLRWKLGQPLAAANQDDEAPSTRTEQAAFDVLSELDSASWHSVHVIAPKVGSQAVTERALHALARQGKVFLWGEGLGKQVGDRWPLETRWGTRDPLALVTAWGKGWKGRGGHYSEMARLRTMLLGASAEIRSKVSDICAEVTGLAREKVEFYELTPEDQMAADMEKRRLYYASPEYAVAKAAEEARVQQEGAERAAVAKAHDAEQKRLDREHRSGSGSDEAECFEGDLDLA